MSRWYRSFDFIIGVLLVCASPLFASRAPRPTTLYELGLWFGCIVLGTGLILDVWRLAIDKAGGGPTETAMCVESIVGVGWVAAGLAFLIRPDWHVTLSWSAVVAFWGFSAIYAAWGHDLVFVQRGGRWLLSREPDHGSFIVQFRRARTGGNACPLTGGHRKS